MHKKLLKSSFILVFAISLTACGSLVGSPSAGTDGNNISVGKDHVLKDSDLAQEMNKRQLGSLSPKAETAVHFTDGTDNPIIPYTNTVAWEIGFTVDFLNPDPKTSKVKAVDISNHISDHVKDVTIYYYTKKGVKFGEEIRSKNAVINNGTHFNLASKYPAGTTLDNLTTILTLAIFDEGGNKYYIVGPPMYIKYPTDAVLTNVE